MARALETKVAAFNGRPVIKKAEKKKDAGSIAAVRNSFSHHFSSLRTNPICMIVALRSRQSGRYDERGMAWRGAVTWRGVAWWAVAGRDVARRSILFLDWLQREAAVLG